MYANWPPTLTVTPSSVVGSTPFTTELFQLSVTVERLAPLMVSHALGTMPDAKLAPFSASVITGLVRTPTGRASDWLIAPPINRATGRLPLGVVTGSWIVTWYSPVEPDTATVIFFKTGAGKGNAGLQAWD